MHIDVEMMSGENVPHEMETTDSIMEIKKSIQDKAGADPQVLKLHFQGEELPNDLSLDVVKSRAGNNTVPLVCKERVNVNVEMMSGAKDDFAMWSYDTILDVKKNVAKKEFIEHTLIHLNMNGEELHDDQCLEDAKVKAGSNDLKMIAKERDEISIQMPSGETVPMEAEPTDSVLNIKTRL